MTSSDKRRARMREYMKRRRAEAKMQGVVLKSDGWAADNPEKHLARTRRWRANNLEKAQGISRASQTRRRSTPWGKINNRMWPIVHNGVKTNTSILGKYNKVLGYKWSELRRHLESLFDERMTWNNWGDYWQLDHIRPLSSFKYENINDEDFLLCWSFGNLRPLRKDLNIEKGDSW